MNFFDNAQSSTDALTEGSLYDQDTIKAIDLTTGSKYLAHVSYIATKNRRWPVYKLTMREILEFKKETVKRNGADFTEIKLDVSPTAIYVWLPRYRHYQKLLGDNFLKPHIYVATGTETYNGKLTPTMAVRLLKEPGMEIIPTMKTEEGFVTPPYFCKNTDDTAELLAANAEIVSNLFEEGFTL